MKEAKRGQIVIIKSPKFNELEGVITSVESDRLTIYYSKDFEEQAMSLSEGDRIFVRVHTQFGIKPLNSIVISSPQKDNELVIENTSSIGICQKRAFVRAATNFRFFIKTEKNLIGATCVDISAGGVKFKPDENIFKIGDTLTFKYLSEEFGKNFTLEAQIINIIGENLVAKYTNIGEFDRDKISGFCIKTLSGQK